MDLSTLLKEKRTLLMGVLNVTPDSFSDGGKYLSSIDAIKRAKQMLSEGADIIDIGGESTRPGSESVSEEEELRRVIPVITELKRELGDQVLISIDTYKSSVARQALKAGAGLVNSLGGFRFDSALIEVVKEYACPIVLYHIKGEPKTMQQGEITYTNVIAEITAFFEAQIALGLKQGILRENFLLDPGIGFGKTVEHNLTIIRELDTFKSHHLPIVIGVSRKSHLAKLLQEELSLSVLPSPDQRLEAALAETAVAVLHGAKIVRTHDVLQTKKFLTVLERLR